MTAVGIASPRDAASATACLPHAAHVHLECATRNLVADTTLRLGAGASRSRRVQAPATPAARPLPRDGRGPSPGYRATA